MDDAPIVWDTSADVPSLTTAEMEYKMPNFSKDKKSEPDELEATRRILDTVQKQISSYQLSLMKVRNLKQECENDPELNKRIRSSPEEMATVLFERGVSAPIAIGMAAEDFQAPNFAGAAGIWTWDCCSSCCITSCIGTNITNFADELRNPVPFEVLIGRATKVSDRGVNDG
jgi:hypothetical protein